jgi:hypothetical protein
MMKRGMQQGIELIVPENRPGDNDDIKSGNSQTGRC